MIIYQLIGQVERDDVLTAITLCVSEDVRKIQDSACLAIGRGGWWNSDLWVYTWNEGQPSQEVAWADFS